MKIDQINRNKEVIDDGYSIMDDKSSNDKRVNDDGYSIKDNQSN
jgi:hypothetical protein